MRRLADGLGWAVLLAALVGVGLYVGLQVTRGISPPLVPVEPGQRLPGMAVGDAVLLQRAVADEIGRGDVLAVPESGRTVLAVVSSYDQEGTTVHLVLVGGPAGGTVETDHRAVVGIPDRKVPLAGWLLIPLRERTGQIGAAFVGVLLALGLLLGRHREGAPAGEPVWATETLALPAAPEPRALEPTGPPHEEVAHPPFVAGPAGLVSAAGADAGAVPSEPPVVAYGERPMGITPDDLRQVRFAQTRKGYDTEAVDRALESVAGSIEHLLQERQQLVDRVQALEAEVERYKGMEASLGQTLAMAERTAEDLKAEAHAEAQRIVASARQQAAGTPRQAVPADAMVQLLGETRAIRSLLQAVLQGGPPGQQSPPPPQPGSPGQPPAQQHGPPPAQGRQGPPPVQAQPAPQPPGQQQPATYRPAGPPQPQPQPPGQHPPPPAPPSYPQPQ